MGMTPFDVFKRFDDMTRNSVVVSAQFSEQGELLGFAVQPLYRHQLGQINAWYDEAILRNFPDKPTWARDLATDAKPAYGAVELDKNLRNLLATQVQGSLKADFAVIGDKLTLAWARRALADSGFDNFFNRADIFEELVNSRDWAKLAKPCKPTDFVNGSPVHSAYWTALTLMAIKDTYIRQVMSQIGDDTFAAAAMAVEAGVKEVKT